MAWGMDNDRYINDNEISIIDQDQTNTQPQSNVRPSNSGAVVHKAPGKISGVVVDLNEAITAGIMTAEIGMMKVTGTMKTITIQYKSTDEQPDWTDLFVNTQVTKGERIFTFTPIRVGKVAVFIGQIPGSSTTATFQLDIFGCFQVHCKLQYQSLICKTQTYIRGISFFE
jgi:hypothetical protein